MVIGRSLTGAGVLLDVDDLAAAVRAAVPAHPVRELGDAALRTDRSGRGGELAVRRTPRMRAAPRRLALGDGHRWLLLVLYFSTTGSRAPTMPPIEDRPVRGCWRARRRNRRNQGRMAPRSGAPTAAPGAPRRARAAR